MPPASRFLAAAATAALTLCLPDLATASQLTRVTVVATPHACNDYFIAEQKDGRFMMLKPHFYIDAPEKGDVLVGDFTSQSPDIYNLRSDKTVWLEVAGRDESEAGVLQRIAPYCSR